MEKVPEQHILQKYSKCSRFGVMSTLLKIATIAITHLAMDLGLKNTKQAIFRLYRSAITHLRQPSKSTKTRPLPWYLSPAAHYRGRNTFSEISTLFSFFTKIQDGRQKWRKSKFFPFPQDTLVLPCGSKIWLKSLYLLWFEIFTHFHFPQKSKMAAKSRKSKFFLFAQDNLVLPFW